MANERVSWGDDGRLPPEDAPTPKSDMTIRIVGKRTPVVQQDAGDRYLIGMVTPEEGNTMGLRTGHEGKQTWQGFEKRVTADVAKGPDKTVAGWLMTYENRVNRITGHVLNGDIDAAVAEDRALLEEIKPIREYIDQFSYMDVSNVPDKTMTRRVHDVAFGITANTVIDRDLQMPDGTKFKYGVLRDPEQIKQLNVQKSDRLGAYGFDNGVAQMTLGDTSKFFTGDEIADPSKAGMIRDSNETARRAFSFLTSNALASQGRNGTTARIDGDPVSREAATEAGNELHANWRRIYDAFGTGTDDLVRRICSRFNDESAGAALRVATAAAGSVTDLKGPEKVREVMDQIGEFFGAATKSEGGRRGTNAEHDLNVSVAAAAGFCKMAERYGVKVDLKSPDVLNAIQRSAGLNARMRDAGINLTASLRDANRSVSDELASPLAKARGLAAPGGLLDVADDIMNDRQVSGASDDVRRIPFFPSLQSDYRNDRNVANGGGSSFPYADDLASSVQKVKSRHLWSVAVKNGTDKNGALSAIMSSSKLMSDYAWDVRDEFMRAMPGSKEERAAAASVLTRRVLSGEQVPLVDYVRSLVSDGGFAKANPAAHRSLKSWLSTVGSDDAEMLSYADQIYAKFLASGADRDEASARTVRIVDSLRRERAKGEDVRRHVDSLMHTYPILFNVGGKGGRQSYTIMNTDVGTLVGQNVQVGDQVVPVREGRIREAGEELARASRVAAGQIHAVNLAGDRKSATDD